MMHTNLQQLRAVRACTCAMVQDLSQAQLDYVPKPGEWSIGAVLHHLILSEQFLRGEMALLIERTQSGQNPYVYRSFAAFNARPAFLPECALAWCEAPLNMLNTFMPASLREYVIRHVPVRVLAPDVLQPHYGKCQAELAANLGTALHDTEALFAANPMLDYNRMHHQHPLFGLQTVPQLLRMLWLHEQAHQEQMTRVLASPQFPRAA